MKERHGIAGAKDLSKMAKPQQARVTVEDADGSVDLICASYAGIVSVGLKPEEARRLAEFLWASANRVAILTRETESE